MKLSGRLPAPTRRPQSEKKRELGLWQSFFLTCFCTLALVLFLLYRQHRWVDRGQRTVVVIHPATNEGVRQKLTLIVLDPLQSDVRILPLPPQQNVVTVLPRFGAYQSDALVGLTLLEKLDWQFLELTLAQEYGVVLDGAVWTQEQNISTLSDVKGLAWKGITRQSKTTFSYWDSWVWWRLLGTIPSHQVEVAPLTEWIDEEGRLREVPYETWAETKIQDEQIRQSGLSVVVQNGTEQQGQAQRTARMLKLIGYAVRNIETVTTQESTKIVLNPQRAEQGEVRWALQRLQDLYPWAEVVEDAGTTQKARSDIVLILGKDQEGSLTLRRP